VASKTAVKGCPEAYSDPVSLNADGTYATKHVLEKEDHLFVFICIKVNFISLHSKAVLLLKDVAFDLKTILALISALTAG
jgi:hypothetical protein